MKTTIIDNIEYTHNNNELHSAIDISVGEHIPWQGVLHHDILAGSMNSLFEED